MALFVIGDLHLALGCDKPMDIFPGWEGYLEKLERNWRRLIAPEDTVVLAGDTSWSMQLENCYEDFSFIHSLPGQKLVLKGNHDYWWSTQNKMSEYVAANGFTSMRFLFNNSYRAEKVWFCGTRGWMVDNLGDHDKKILARESGRLRMSLGSANPKEGEEIVAILHYPPVNVNTLSEEFVSAMRDFGVRRCYYGHLHGPSINRAVQGEIEGIQYELISADALGFEPREIRRHRDSE